MLKKVLTVACATVAAVAASIAAPAAARANAPCEGDNYPAYPFQYGDGVASRFVWAGYELFVEPVHGFTGVTLCYEVAGTSGSVHVSLHPTSAATNEVSYRVAYCDPAGCTDVLRRTGARIGTVVPPYNSGGVVGAGLGFTCVWADGAATPLNCGDTTAGVAVDTNQLPAPVLTGCFVVNPCVPYAQVVYGGNGAPTVVVILNGLALAPAVTEQCVQVPGVVCP